MTDESDADESLDLASAGSRVLVVGAGTYVSGSRLPDVPAVARTVADLAELLVERCRVRPENLRTLLDPPDPIALGRAVEAAVDSVTDVLVLYYIGHGLVSPGNELYLATAATDDDLIGLSFKALPYQAIRDALGTSRAQSIIVVLDCCFAGRARGSLASPPVAAFELASMGGTYLLAAASADEQALAVPGDTHTTFTGALIALLDGGDPAGLPHFTIDAVYRHLRRELPRRHVPAPNRSLSGTAGDCVLAPNPAAPTPTPTMSGAPEIVSAEAAAQVCPYRGLSPFTADDARYYFGQETVLQQLLRSVSAFALDEGPVFVVGVSGVGKSSLLQAGFLPAIARGELRLPGARTWPRLYLTPGRHPTTTLAARLAAGGPFTAETIAERLAYAPHRMTQVVEQTLRVLAGGTEVEGGRLIVVVDQFEEIFTTCDNEDERHAFVAALNTISKSRALVVAAVRADFYPRCAEYPELAAALQDRQVLVAPMAEPQLRDAITKPAAVSGLSLEPGLADQLLTDLGADRDSAGTGLPLLSYALQQTWARRTGTTLTLAGYQASGGIRNAVTQQADLAFASLDQAGQDAARTLLLRMVHLGTNTEDTRRSIDLDELLRERPADAAALRAARDALAAHRLIILDDSTASIAHDALLRAWPRLRRWIEDDRSNLLVHQQLTEDAAAWQRAGRQRDLLYRGARLTAARTWVQDTDHSAQLTPVEQRFLTTSVRSRWRSRALAFGVVLVMLLAVASGGIAVSQYRSVQRQTALDNSTKMARTADGIRDSDPAAALQFSLAAYRTAPTPQARAALLAASTTPFPIRLSADTGHEVLRLATSSDAKTLAASDNHGSIRVWDIADVHHPARGADIAPQGGVAAIAFIPGTEILVGQSPTTLQLWDVSNLLHPVQLSAATFPESSTDDLAVSPSGNIVAAAGLDDGVLRLWDISDRRHPILTAAHTVGPTGIHAVAFAPDRPILATGSAVGEIPGEDGAFVRLWNIADPKNPTLLSTVPVADVWGLSFDDDQHRLVAVGQLHSFRILDTTDPGAPAALCPDGAGKPDPLTGPLVTVQFDPLQFGQDSETFVTSDYDGTIDRWRIDAHSGCASTVSTRPAGEPVTAISTSHDGRVIAGATEAGQVELWSAPGVKPLGPILPSSEYDSSTFSPDDKVFAGGMIWRIGNFAAGPDIQLPDDDKDWIAMSVLPKRNIALAVSGDFSSASLWDIGNIDHPRRLSILDNPGEWFLYGWSATPDGNLLAVPRNPGPQVDLVDITDPSNPHLVTAISGFDQMQPFTPSDLPAVQYPLVVTEFFDKESLIVSDGSGVHIIDISDPADVRHIDTLLKGQRKYWPTIVGHYLVVGGADVASHPDVLDLTDPRHPKSDGVVLAPSAHGVAALGSTMVAAATKQSIDIWDLRNRELVASVSAGHNIEEGTVAVSPDKHILAAMTDTGAIDVWDVTDPHNPIYLNGIAESHLPPDASKPIFSHDATTLAFVADDDILGNGSLLVDIDPEQEYKHLCSIAPHSIDPDLWKRYLPAVPPTSPCP
jgi:WD40 repeat protein